MRPPPSFAGGGGAVASAPPFYQGQPLPPTRKYSGPVATDHQQQHVPNQLPPSTAVQAKPSESHQFSLDYDLQVRNPPLSNALPGFSASFAPRPGSSSSIRAPPAAAAAAAAAMAVAAGSSGAALPDIHWLSVTRAVASDPLIENVFHEKKFDYTLYENKAATRL